MAEKVEGFSQRGTKGFFLSVTTQNQQQKKKEFRGKPENAPSTHSGNTPGRTTPRWSEAGRERLGRFSPSKARLRSAHAVTSFELSPPVFSSSTSGRMAPAWAMAAWLSPLSAAATPRPVLRFGGGGALARGGGVHTLRTFCKSSAHSFSLSFFVHGCSCPMHTAFFAHVHAFFV